MAFIIHNCDCKTCKGSQAPPKGTIGGTICNCNCHQYSANSIVSKIVKGKQKLKKKGKTPKYVILSEQHAGCLFQKAKYFESNLIHIVKQHFFEKEILVLDEAGYKEYMIPSTVVSKEISIKEFENLLDKPAEKPKETKWEIPSFDELFMRHAYLMATKSKDLHTKIGAVLVKDKSIISEGYNGFPRKINDTNDERNQRPTKYEYVVHSEMNCICNCAKKGISSDNSILYCFALPCSNCTKALINAGIIEIVHHKQWDIIGINKNDPKWIESSKHSEIMLNEAGVIIREFDKVLNIKTMVSGKVHVV